MKKLIVLVLFLTALGASAQKQYYIRYYVEGFTGNKAVLQSMYGSTMTPIDSVAVEYGMLEFTVDSGLPTGIYRILLTDTIFTDLIFNNENIDMRTIMFNILPAMQVMESFENMVLFNYWKYAVAIKDSITRLSLESSRAIRQDGGSPGKNYQLLYDRLVKLNNSVPEYAENLGKMYPNLFVGVLLKSYQKPDYQAYMKRRGAVPYPNEKEFYRVHFFENFDFSNPALLRTNVVYTAINDYITNFGQPPSTENYIRNIDFILSKLAAGEEAYDYGLNLFITNFENSVFENVYFHLINNHLAKQPNVDPSLVAYHRARMDVMRSLEIGRYAPNATFADTMGNTLLLKDIMAQAKLLFFWSPGCEHCEELIPEIKEIYELYKSYGFEVIAFAVTPDADYWKSTIRKYDAKWLNVSDLKGMASPVARNYNIWMTPILFILDKDNKITGRPRSIPEIHARLVELLPLDR